MDAARPPARSPLMKVFAARAARAAFGATLMAGALAVVSAVAQGPRLGGKVLLLMVPLALLVGFVVKRVALFGGPWLARRQRAFGGAPSVPVGALSSAGVSERLRALNGRLELPSYALPLVGLSLLAPLTLHSPLFLLGGGGLDDLGDWIGLSVGLVGLAHITLAILSYRFARRLYRGALVRSVEREALRAIGLTTLAGSVPGIFFFAIPPALVAITGLLFVPASYVVIARCCLRERAILQEG